MADDTVAAAASGKVASAPASKRKVKPGAQLESQDDLAYLQGEHQAAESEKQIRTPAPRRPAGKPKQSSRGNRP